MIALVCGIQTKRYKRASLQNRNRLLESELMGYQGKTSCRGINQEFQMNTHTAIYKADNQQGPPVHSRGNSAQHSVITYLRKESRRG